MHGLFLQKSKKVLFLDESNCKPYKTCVDKDSKVYNRSIKSWQEKNAIEMYSTHNKLKFAAAEIFITTLKNEMYKYMTSVLKRVYVKKLDDIVNKYNNAYHRKIKMNLVDVKSSTYI